MHNISIGVGIELQKFQHTDNYIFLQSIVILIINMYVWCDVVLAT